MIALFAVMLIGVTTVNAVEVTDEEQEFCIFTIQSSKGNIDNIVAFKDIPTPVVLSFTVYVFSISPIKLNFSVKCCILLVSMSFR